MTKPRKHLTHAELLDRMPRAFRPKLDAGQQRDLALIHVVQLDAIATGAATEANLWEWVGCVLTWFRSATLIGRHIDEMALQHDLATRLVKRYRSTGRIVFTGPDYQLAKVGVDVMDRLARIVDLPTGKVASEWSEDLLQRLKAGSESLDAMKRQIDREFEFRHGVQLERVRIAAVLATFVAVEGAAA